MQDEGDLHGERCDEPAIIVTRRLIVEVVLAIVLVYSLLTAALVLLS